AIILMEVPFFYIHHDTITEIVLSFAYIGSINLITLVMIEMSVGLKRVVENNFMSLFRLLEKPTPSVDWASSNMHILIFNWRDIKHRYSGGAEVYVHELAKRWVKAGN